jgi:hypothetical protein
MCVYMHSCFVKNHPILILEDSPLISEVVLSQQVSKLDRAEHTFEASKNHSYAYGEDA